MSMIVISDRVMCCTDCGGFHFLAYESISHKLKGGFVYKELERNGTKK